MPTVPCGKGTAGSRLPRPSAIKSKVTEIATLFQRTVCLTISLTNFGHDAAGQDLKSARALSARMVEQGEAATCDYAEANRRRTAIQFVIHAFNGEVDSILSKVMSDNSGTLAQKIRDASSTVNQDGTAFRNARILPAYLDARLAELDSAVRMREFVQKVRDEQRAERERMRDEQKAEQERQEKLRAAARDEELKRQAVAEAEQKFAEAATEQRDELQRQLEEAQRQLAEAAQRKRDIPRVTGSIYVISNEGSFGKGKYKIGFTRRDPETRVEELYNASVPFEFEIHGVISTTPEDAPNLEYRLHREFLAQRWNKKNFGKEFFLVEPRRYSSNSRKTGAGERFPRQSILARDRGGSRCRMAV